ETSAKLLSNARLQASENVETLRSHLVNNEPCPVCGSHDHPFVAENPLLDLILSGLEDTHLENEGVYDEFLNKLTNAQQTINGMEHTIQQLEQEITVKNESCQKFEKTWKEFKIFKDCNIIADNEKQAWLQNKIKLFKADQSAVQIKISNYYTALQKQEQQQTVVTQLEKDITAFTNTLKDIERNRQTEEGNLFRFQGEVEQCNADIKLVEQLMTPYFQSSDWIASWKKDTKTFTERITSFANKWKTNTAKLETDKKEFAVLSAVIKGLEDSEKVLLKDTEKKTKILSDLKDSLELLKTRRKFIFDGIEVDVVEARFKQAIDKAEENLNGLNTENNELTKKSTISATQKEQCVKEMARLDKSVSGYSTQIQTRIATYNTQNEQSIDEEQAIGLLLYSYDQIHTERNALKVIADAVTRTLSVLGERKKLLKQHEQRKASERDLETVNNLYLLTKKECEAITKLRNDISFKLQQDIENKEKVGHLLIAVEAQEVIFENWSKLNDLIGSADGKKFRQIAQEYTLDVLLSYANIHLELLTKRYLIQRISGSLALQVLDRDMGDEIRTVFSLSGGESFLVSLALALGLASLSSNRMKVESLFIDEGFGSLDPVTLNIAMDALEQLHNQGRKVGVISHVQEMTERIPTQIKVRKLANGKSKISVAGI
ncbi:MAG TPA: SbcC/MukB-like Walker B domain-containing protein, partial [Mucilaginibacter sp.]